MLLGSYTEKERTDFINEFALEYLQRHPDERPSKARRRARMYWARKVKSKQRRNKYDDSAIRSGVMANNPTNRVYNGRNLDRNTA